MRLYEAMDLATLCAVAQDNTLAIPDVIFRRKLEPLCPWFEPQFSHRNSYKECAIEYVRRLQPGAKFASMRKVSPQELGVQETNPSDYIVFDSRVRDRTILGESGLTALRIPMENLDEFYTSDHGITLRLRMKTEDQAETEEYKALAKQAKETFDLKDDSDAKDEKNFPNEEDQTVYAEIVSLPDVLIVMVMFHDPTMSYQNNFAFVKFKDSPGVEADAGFCEANHGYSVQVMGSHVFLIEHGTNRSGQDPWYNISYLSNGQAHRVLRVTDVEGSRPKCYDGLWQFFDFEEEQYRAYQASLMNEEGLTKRRAPIDETCVEDVMPHGFADGLLMKGDCRYGAIAARDGSTYFHDLPRGCVVDMDEAIESKKDDK